MRAAESLNLIQPQWLTTVSHRLAQGEGLRENFSRELDRFFILLKKALESGNYGCLDPQLTEWVKARTQTDLDEDEASLPQVISTIMMTTYEVANEKLPQADALELIGALLPIFSHAYEYANRQETLLQVEHISVELEKATNSLEKLEQSKSDFISVAAHELKTPLTLIEGYTSMIRELTPEELRSSSFFTYLKGIDAGSHRLREIVDDMIDVSMIDNNLLSINYQPLWFDRLFKIIEREMAERIRGRKQTLKVHHFPGWDDMNFGDGERLLQAFRNLISNAIKYTPDGGNITVGGRILPGFIEITIADTGIGIDPEAHIRIFEKFGNLGNVALHSTSKVRFKGGGPGLGLPITKGIIEAHGGAIWVESPFHDEVKCPGSTFHVLLPIRKEVPSDKTSKLFQTISE